MRPVIKKISLYDLPKICKCKKKCTEGVTITFWNDGTILCKQEARMVLFSLMKELDAAVATGWTEADEQYIIDKYEADGMYHGFNSDVAAALGKTYHQVKSKVQKLRKKGFLKGKEPYNGQRKANRQKPEVK